MCVHTHIYICIKGSTKPGLLKDSIKGFIPYTSIHWHERMICLTKNHRTTTRFQKVT